MRRGTLTATAWKRSDLAFVLACCLYRETHHDLTGVGWVSVRYLNQRYRDEGTPREIHAALRELVATGQARFIRRACGRTVQPTPLGVERVRQAGRWCR